MTDKHAGYDAARTGAAVGERGARGWLRVSGADALSFLHGILTNDIVSLESGHWCYAAYLTPQGRMLSDMRVLRRDDDVALETEPEVVDMLATRFDASIFTERVQIASGERSDYEGPPPLASSSSPGMQSLVICGPTASGVLASILGSDSYVVPRAHEFVEVGRHANRFVLIGHEDLGIPAVDVLGAADACSALEGELRDAGAVSLDATTLEALRIEAGTPRFGVDMADDTIPLEAGIEGRAISMTKGCYVGQEVIVRILHRGQGRVARRLVGLRMDDRAVPVAGTLLSAGDREIGAVTSAAVSPRLDRAIALGYVHRDFAEEGTRLTVRPAGTQATVTRLPFVT